MVMSPVGLGTENYYAGEDQQQFNSQDSHLKCPDGLRMSHLEV
jgi:hypothetical protein